MNFQRAITPTITIADQPTEADLEMLKGAGFVAVVNLRNDGEPEQPLGTEAEGAKVRALGMDYAQMGVGGGPLSSQAVDDVCKFIGEHAEKGKVLVHCRKGARAAGIVLIQQALAHGWLATDAAAQGKAMGLEVDGGLRQMVETYLDSHRKVD